MNNSFFAKFRIIKESRAFLSNIGIGLSDVEGINYCPYFCTRQNGKFVCFYTYRGIGGINLSDVGTRKQTRQYKGGKAEDEYAKDVDPSK
jgi:hypothetical protein